MEARNGAGLPQRDDAAVGQSKGDGKPPASSRTREQNLEAAITLLAKLFPKAFFVFEQRRKPLKIGIRDDILAAFAGVIAPRDLSAALGYYTRNVGYLRAMLCGAYRIDLDGNVAGVVDRDQEIAAKQKLAAIAAKQARRKQELKKQKATVAVQPKRDGLAELREAAWRRKAGAP